MKIECKLKRQDGSKIDLGGKEYHFAPGADGAHVADVEDDDHIARLLSIPEAYRIYKDAAPAAKPEDDQSDDADLRADLAAEYEVKLGKKPHYNLSIEKMRAAIAEAE